MTEEQENVVLLTTPAVFIDLSKEGRRWMAFSSKPNKSARYICDAHFCDLEKLQGMRAGDALEVSIETLLCDRPYNLKRQRKLRYTGYDLFKMNEIDNFCDLANRLIQYDSHVYLFFSFELQSSAWWKKLQFLT